MKYGLFYWTGCTCNSVCIIQANALPLTRKQNTVHIKGLKSKMVLKSAILNRDAIKLCTQEHN